MSRTLELEAGRTIVERGQADPVWFIEGVLGGRLWEQQKAIARATFRHPRVAVKACHASGKTYIAAYITLAFFYLYQNAKVITTAPTWTQVETLLWGELRAAYARMPSHMGGTLLQTELKAAPNWWARGLSTNEGVKFQGHHGEHILIIIDEAPGVAADIWEAIEGVRAGGNVHVLALGNPTIASGPFYDAFTSQRTSWHTVTISAFDTPNLIGLDTDAVLALDAAGLAESPLPYLTTRAWVREKYDDWGPDSPLWQSRVLGNFPMQGEDALLSLAWLEAAALREPVEDTTAPICAGLDVAGPGEDETVLVIRQGPNVLSMQHWAHPDPRGEVAAALQPYRGRLEPVNVDSAGIGYYLAKHLEDLDIPVQYVNVGERPGDPEKYVNLKAELYWGLRLYFQSEPVAGLFDDRAITQLAGIRYSHNARGQVVIESKEQARKRGVKSPDRAEAMMLAFAPAHNWRWA